jgi:sugar O-acyltransferase (sialic acid O-acetyltransferase NeuD family)
MIIIGAKGFAKEVLEICHKNGLESIAFFDNVNNFENLLLFNKFPILKTDKEVENYFEVHGNNYTIGVGNPILRKKLHDKFQKLGGKLIGTISPKAEIGSFGNEIGSGCNIMTNAVITNNVKIGTGVLINLSCTIGHDAVISDFSELCPDVNVSGNCFIGSFTFLGTNSTVLPNVSIGNNVIVGAGSVVTKNIPDNCLVMGIPAKVIKELEPLPQEMYD